MATSLKVVALISGGKDSLFSILHCIAHKHEVVALANLYPAQLQGGTYYPELDGDLNSYMYQTVGHEIIPLYEEALGIPLFRREISGSAVNTDRDYATPQDGEDETESLIPLLKMVKRAIPEVNAVCTGAILSTYQRTRVESVALRLGLTPLSFLWQYPSLPPYHESALLYDMAAVGQDARIIKVASGGLDSSYLWENVADTMAIIRLKDAMGRFGKNGDGAILGEGGEFETLTIDGPDSLWKKKIQIERDGVFLGEGGTSIFRVKEASLVDKAKDGEGLTKLRIPDLWDAEFFNVLSLGAKRNDIQAEVTFAPQYGTGTWRPRPTRSRPNQTFTTQQTIVFANFALDAILDYRPTPSHQLRFILDRLAYGLSIHQLDPANVCHITLLLRDIADFADLNPIYGSFFTTPNPPSRVTVSCAGELPPGIDVMLSAIVWKGGEASGGSGKRNGLHVQSRSYWAPANIGPYSQAISVPVPTTSEEDDEGEAPEIVYMAGQIPLEPATMERFEGGLWGQALLGLQHIWRIGRAMQVQYWPVGVAYISKCSKDETIDRVQFAQRAWHLVHEQFTYSCDEDDDLGPDIDPWDLMNRFPSSAAEREAKTYRAPIPEPTILSDGKPLNPPAFVVQVAELPRHVNIEWHTTGLAKCQVHVQDKGILSDSVVVTEVVGTNTAFVGAEIKARDTLDDFLENMKLCHGVIDYEHVTLYSTYDLGSEWFTGFPGLQWVPCLHVWNQWGKEAVGILVARVTLKYISK